MDLQHSFSAWVPQEPAYEQHLRAAVQNGASSGHPLQRLRRAVRLNLVFAIVITVGYGFLFTQLEHTSVLLLFSLVVAYNGWAITNTLRLYRRMPTNVSALNDLLAELKVQVSATDHWMRLHQRVGLLMYPLAATGGFLLGGVAGSGLEPEAFMAKPGMWIFLGVTLAVLVPLCHVLVKWMTHKAFGVHVEDLRARIQELED